MWRFGSSCSRWGSGSTPAVCLRGSPPAFISTQRVGLPRVLFQLLVRARMGLDGCWCRCLCWPNIVPFATKVSQSLFFIPYLRFCFASRKAFFAFSLICLMTSRFFYGSLWIFIIASGMSDSLNLNKKSKKLTRFSWATLVTILINTNTDTPLIPTVISLSLFSV